MPTYYSLAGFWLLVMVLTVVSANFAEQPQLSSLLITIVLLITAVKSGVIVDYFMGLKKASAFWRWIMMLYVPLVSIIIGASYAL